MLDQSDMLDAATLFDRIRRNVPSGIGSMTGSEILWQMGGRRGESPYGWSDKRIRAAWGQLLDEESIECTGMVGQHYVTAKGIGKYEGAD